jgi:fucose permease
LRLSLSPQAALLMAGVLTFMVMGAGQSIYGPALPAFSRDFGVSIAEAGALISALWIGSAVGTVIMLLIGRRMQPAHALAVMAAGAALVAAGIGWWATVAASVIFGAGYGIAAAVFNPRVLKAYADRGPAMVSLLNATFAAGAILAPLAYVWGGSRPMLAFGVVAVLCALIFVAALPASRDGAEAAKAVTQPYRFRPLILTFAVFGIATEACLIGLGPTALIRAGLTEATAAQLLSGFFVCFLLIRIALVFVAGLFQPFTLYLVAMGFSALCALSAAVLPPGPFFVLLGLSAGMFFPGAYVTATRQMGDHPNVAPSILAAGQVGGIASPILLGMAVQGMGDRGFFWVIGIGALAVTLVALMLRRRMA